MTDRVCELFCGAGGIGLGFSRHFHVTDAIDILPEAAARIRVRDLRYTNPYGDGGGQTRLTGLLGGRASERGGE